MTQQPRQKISVLIVDDIPETRENLRKLLYFEPDIEIVGTADNGQRAVDEARRLQPDIVLMDINMPDMDGITASQEIGRVAPVTQIIMMSVQSETDYLRRSMMAGAKYFLTKPFTSEELSTSIHRVYDMGATSRVASRTMLASETGAPISPVASLRRPSTQGKLLVVYSPKGGTGCSLVAANLAIALAQITSKKVALVDTSLQFGDVGVLLDLQGAQSIADAANRVNELDSDLLNVLMASHPSGIKVLTAPSTPVASERITPAILKKVLAQLIRDFDYVLLDTWSHLDDIVLSAIDLADRVLVVMTPEMPSIKSTKQFFEITEALEFRTTQIDLILNQIIPRNGIRADQIENSMKHAILAQFEYEPRGIRQAINQGVPLIMSQPSHPLAEKFLQLAQQEVLALEPEPAEAPTEAVLPKAEPQKRNGLFGRLKK
jgi:pilus assembly protein CpaE